MSESNVTEASEEEQARNKREEVARIFTEAGWTAGTKDGWDGQFVWRDSVIVGGIDPYDTPRATGMAANSTEWPSDIIGAAHWLVDHAKQFAPDLTTEATLEPPLAQLSEGVKSQGDESNGETGEEAEGGSAACAADTEGGVREGATSDEGSENYAAPGEALESDFLDADFTEGQDLGSELLDVESELSAPELPSPDPEDFAPDEFAPEEDQSGAFIFGDNLHQMRTAAIGLVVQAALTRLPEPTDYAKLSELRNFAMGVSENRWPDDPARRDELDAMEAIERRRFAITASRDEKVAFLVDATREDVEAFDPEAGWP